MSQAKHEFYCYLLLFVGVLLLGLGHLYMQEQCLESLRQPIEGGSCVEQSWKALQPPLTYSNEQEQPHVKEKTTR